MLCLAENKYEMGIWLQPKAISIFSKGFHDDKGDAPKKDGAMARGLFLTN